MDTNTVKLLIYDLGARLAYNTMLNVTYNHSNKTEELISVYADGNYAMVNDMYYIDEVKPYLRKQSDMTKEEFCRFSMMCNIVGQSIDDYSEEDAKRYCSMTSVIYTRFCYAHHIDINGLIEKGLALEAPADMYDLSECEDDDTAILEMISVD